MISKAAIVFAICVSCALIDHSEAASPTPSPAKHRLSAQRKPVTALPAITVEAAKKPGKLTQAQVTANPLSVLTQFALSDLQAALADAQGQTPPDAVSVACYTALINLVQSPPQNILPSGLGIFQAVQKARDAANLLASIQSNSGPIEALNIACAPWVIGNGNILTQIGIATGLVISGVP